MNFSPFAHATPLKSVSLSRGSVGNSSFRTNPDAAKAYFGWVGTLLVAAGSVVGINNGVKGALVYQQNDALHISEGRQGAIEDKIRQSEIIANIPGVGLRQLNGNATPYGANYSLLSKHLFSGLVTNNIPFTIAIAKGPSKNERLQIVNVTNVISHPTEDIAIVVHNPILGATVPNIGPIEDGQIAKFYGFENYAYVGDTSPRNDGQPRMWIVKALRDGPREAEQFTSALGISLLPGFAINTNSASSGWNDVTGDLSLLLDSGVEAYNNINSQNSSIRLNSVKPWLIENTPLNQVPETTLLLPVALAALSLIRKRK